MSISPKEISYTMRMEELATHPRANLMFTNELATLSALALGFVTFGVVLTASVSILRTTYTIAPRQVRRLKTWALKTMAAAAVTGAAAILI